MNNTQAYFTQIDLSEQKSVSAKKLKDLFTSTIKWKLALMKESSNMTLIDLYHDGAHELLLFATYNLRLYSMDEYNYILGKIAQATRKAIEELPDD